MDSPLNPWARADCERFNVETLALIPDGRQQEYITIMKELAHAKGIVALAIERMYMFDEQRREFFAPMIGGAAVEGEVEVELITPVTDLNEYRGRRG